MRNTFIAALSISFLAMSAFAADAPPTAKPAVKAEAAKPAAEPAKPGATAASEAAASEKAKPDGIDWSTMSAKDKGKYMKKTILPAAKKMFAAFDPKKYGGAKMKCETCHGEKAMDRKFKMPNPDLPKLPTTSEGFKALSEKKPEATKFMGTQVKPKVAEMLNLQEWTMQHQSGFGCYNCHEKAP